MACAQAADYVRQKDILPVDRLRDATVTIIGVGAVGSFVAMALTKMGVGRLEIYDGDVVGPENLPVQWYRSADLGRPKVEALKEALDGLGGEAEVIAHARPFVGQVAKGIVVSAVDSMDTRTSLWRVLRRGRDRTYIDARMGAEIGRILTVNTSSDEDVKWYTGEEIYPSSEAFHAPCTARATIYGAAGLAAFVAAQVGKIVLGHPYKRKLEVDFAQGQLW